MQIKNIYLRTEDMLNIYYINFKKYKYPLVILEDKRYIFYKFRFKYKRVSMKDILFYYSNTTKKIELYELIFNNTIFNELFKANEKYYFFEEEIAVKLLELFKEEYYNLLKQFEEEEENEL